MLLFTHCTTEHGRMLPPVTVNVSAGPPTAAAAGNSVAMLGGPTRFVAGVVIVNGKEVETPNELETLTPAVPAKAVSVAKIEAVS